MIKILFQKDYENYYPQYECQECRHKFFGGGDAVHRKGCTTPGYSNCTKTIGPEIVRRIQAWAEEFGDDYDFPTTETSLNDLKKQIPEALKEMEQHG